MESGLSASGLHGRRMGSLALAGVVVFATTCTAAQFARSDLNWIRSPLSSYLRGDYGWGVKAAYFALSAALILLGIGYYRALTTAARSGAPLLLFATAAVALVVTALAESGSRSGPRGLEAFVHNLAAEARLHRFVVAFTLAMVCFASVWWHAFLVESSRGLTQKTVIALIVAWLALAAHWLRGHDAALVASSDSEGPST